MEKGVIPERDNQGIRFARPEDQKSRLSQHKHISEKELCRQALDRTGSVPAAENEPAGFSFFKGSSDDDSYRSL